MFEDYSDLTERIGETPQWWDENGVPRYLPSAMALPRSYAAIYELLGEAVRQLLWASHLRRQ